MLGVSQQDSKWSIEPDYNKTMEVYSIVSDLKSRIRLLQRDIEKKELPVKEQFPRSPAKYMAATETERDELAQLEALLASAEIELKRVEIHVKLYVQHWYRVLQGKG
jgi:hypothetical protein